MTRISWLAIGLGLLLFDHSARADDKASPNRGLRKPGFLFLELRVHKIEPYVALLRETAGFEPVHIEPDFMVLQSTSAEILLSGGASPPPPDRKHAGAVEIGIAVADLDAAFAKATEHKTWRVGDKIQKQSWGVRDFRLFSPDGYYFRFTEPPR